MANGGEAIKLLTRKCIADTSELALDLDNLATLITEGVRFGRFIGSEWCQGNKEGLWLACDAYGFARNEWIAKANKHMPITYYFKLAISKTGQVVLLVSFHLQH